MYSFVLLILWGLAFPFMRLILLPRNTRATHIRLAEVLDALDEFHRIHGRLPDQLEELVDAQLLSHVPLDGWRKPFVYNASTNELFANGHPEKIHFGRIDEWRASRRSVEDMTPSIKEAPSPSNESCPSPTKW